LPCEARSRKQMRHIPNFLINALGLPHIGHLLYSRTLNFALLNAFALRDFLAKASSLYFDVFVAFHALIIKWHSHKLEEFFSLFVSPGGRNDGNIKPLNLINLVIINFRKNDMLFYSQGVIPVVIKGLA